MDEDTENLNQRLPNANNQSTSHSMNAQNVSKNSKGQQMEDDAFNIDEEDTLDEEWKVQEGVCEGNNFVQVVRMASGA